MFNPLLFLIYLPFQGHFRVDVPKGWGIDSEFDRDEVNTAKDGLVYITANPGGGGYALADLEERDLIYRTCYPVCYLICHLKHIYSTPCLSSKPNKRTSSKLSYIISVEFLGADEEDLPIAWIAKQLYGVAAAGIPIWLTFGACWEGW